MGLILLLMVSAWVLAVLFPLLRTTDLWGNCIVWFVVCDAVYFAVWGVLMMVNQPLMKAVMGWWY